MAIERKFNVLSQSRKEIFPETIYLSRQLFYAIFLAKTALLVYSCTSFLAQLYREFTHVKGSLSGLRHLYQIKKQWNCKRKISPK